MARENNLNREKAFELWRDSAGKKQLKEIAKELGVSKGSVGNWKRDDKWAERALEVGGTLRVLRADLYEEIYWDTLVEREKRMIAVMRMDEEETLLKDQIRLLTVREYRLLGGIGEAQASPDALVVHSTIEVLEQRGHTDTDKGQTLNRTTTNRLTGRQLAQGYEAELTRVQIQKTRCIQALSKLRLEREKFAFMTGAYTEGAQGKTDPFVEALASSMDVWEEDEA